MALGIAYLRIDVRENDIEPVKSLSYVCLKRRGDSSCNRQRDERRAMLDVFGLSVDKELVKDRRLVIGLEPL
jgi:hypothetical protein